MSKIRVLVVDDSSVIRTLLTKLLSTDPEIEVIATAPDPFVAREKLISLKPDVMTLDIEMPRMDGVSFLERVMEHFPTRTIVISSLSTQGSEMALRALEAGAVDVMAKPAIDVTRSLTELASELIQRVKTVSRATLRARSGELKAVLERPVIAKPQSAALARTTHQIVAIASSTGGTEALKEVLCRLPAEIPGTLIVQHMPPGFTKAFAARLNSLCPFEVKEAEQGDRVLPGRVLLAPGNFHMEIVRDGAYYQVVLHQKPSLHGVRPAADYLLNSVAAHAGKNAIGVVLTGMGRDGTDGLKAMREAGSYNIAQDEQSCVVFGMPKAAIDAGVIDIVLPLGEIASKILGQAQLRAVA